MKTIDQHSIHAIVSRILGSVSRNPFDDFELGRMTLGAGSRRCFVDAEVKIPGKHSVFVRFLALFKQREWSPSATVPVSVAYSHDGQAEFRFVGDAVYMLPGTVLAEEVGRLKSFLVS